MTMPEIRLNGCRPEPLMSYLKALGVLRIVSEQADRTARGAWRDDAFVLKTVLQEESLVSFLLDVYQPTPVVAPWAGGSGFFEKDNKEAINLITASHTSRFKPYQEVIENVQNILRKEGQELKPSEAQKTHLLRVYRRELPDAFVLWMDSVLVLQTEGQGFPPILGTGGNDGRLDFTQNFMQRLTDLGLHKSAESQTEQKRGQSSDWLRSAVLGESSGGLLIKAVGQFDPGRVGGPNATQGMEGRSLVNPWDFVLMIEGAMIMAGALARRMGLQGAGRAVFPFTVAASQVGEGSLDKQDPSTARGEIWLPLWEHFAGFSELRLVFSEGRAELSGRQSRDGIEFARAVAGLGTDRGLSGFVRYSFLRRSGKAFIAAPQGRFEITHRPDVHLLEALEKGGWLDNFRRACKSTKPSPPQRFPSALRRLDTAIFNYCRYGGKSRFAAILAALGGIERELALIPGNTVGNRNIHPVPLLSPDWIGVCNEGSPEFRIAVALASIHERKRKGVRTGVEAVRCNLEPVERRGWRYAWADNTRAVLWSYGGLCLNLSSVLERRLVDSARNNLRELPLGSLHSVSLADVAMFLNGRTNDQWLEHFLWGAILVDHQGPWPRPAGPAEFGPRLPRAYALLKLLFLPRRFALKSQSDGEPIRPEPAILGRLRAGDINGACEIAARRLRASGFVPMPGCLPSGRHRTLDFAENIDPMRLAAALLIPIKETVRLKRLVLRKTD